MLAACHCCQPLKQGISCPAVGRLLVQASRLGIATVVSTDSIRHFLRGFHSREDFPLIWASTYEV